MKIVFVNPPTFNLKPVVRDMMGGLGFDGGESICLPPLDLAYYASYLEKDNHQVKIYDCDAEKINEIELISRIKILKPDCIITCVSLPSIETDISIAKKLKEYSKKILINTKINYTPLLERILRESGTELCIFGECEDIIGEIIKGEKFDGTARIEGTKLIASNRCIENLDILPLPARNLLPNFLYRYLLLGSPVTTMQTSRGCPFSCNYYCPYPLVQGKKWRTRSAEHVVEEIVDIVKNHKITNIFFRDATFTLDRERILKICNLIKKEKLNINWWCETRVNCLDDILLQEMSKAGCKGINIGIETGDEKIRLQIAKEGVSNEKIFKIKESADKYQIKLHFLVMIGFPQERKNSLYKTYKFIKKMNPFSFGICKVTPYPGTPLWEEASKKQWIVNMDWEKYGGHFSAMRGVYLSPQEIDFVQTLIENGINYFKLGDKLKLSMVEKTFRKWCKEK